MFAKPLNLTTPSRKTGSLTELGRSTKASISNWAAEDRFPGLKFRNGAETTVPWSSKFMLGYSLANWGQNEEIMSREGNMQVCWESLERVRSSWGHFLVGLISTKCSVPFSLERITGHPSTSDIWSLCHLSHGCIVFHCAWVLQLIYCTSSCLQGFAILKTTLLCTLGYYFGGYILRHGIAESKGRDIFKASASYWLPNCPPERLGWFFFHSTPLPGQWVRASFFSIPPSHSGNCTCKDQTSMFLKHNTPRSHHFKELAIFLLIRI